LAFARHATSKLQRVEDLLRVATFGFRGEALPSIAAAGRVRLITRTPEMATGVRVDAGEEGVRQIGPAAAAPGTTVEVFDLFASTPARRKFLRQPATELGHTADVVTRLAVACPSGLPSLSRSTRGLAPRVDSLRQRAVQVLGAARWVDRRGGGVATSGSGRGRTPRDHLSSARLL
jgi:DNA mismatch repair protein MutL